MDEELKLLHVSERGIQASMGVCGGLKWRSHRLATGKESHG